MRKFFLLAALVLGLAACQNDLDGVNSAPKGEVARLCVSLPDVATRAAAGSEVGGLVHFDANTMDIRYILEVYNEDGTALVKARDIILSDNGSVAFELNLIPNRNYQFVVWADFVANGSKADNYYNTADGLREIALNENAWTAMNESRDAYTGVKKVEGYNSRSEINLQLTRPFGKLRVVTNDLDKLNTGVTPKSVKVTYKANVNSTFDAFTEKVIADTYAAANKEFSYNLADVTAYGDKTNQQTLFVDYLFGVEDGTIQFLMDIDYSDSGSTTKLNFNTEIPIERNKLTTILGSLLTDGNKFDVSIDDDFDNGTEWNPGDDEYDVEIWDGKTLNAPVDSDGDGIYEIGTGSQLGYLAAATNGTLPSTLATRAGEVNWAKQEFVLTQDIDLGGNKWTPIGIPSYTQGFNGVIDGNGHTISNLYVANVKGAGLIGGTVGATVKNLTIDGVELTTNHYAGAIIGWAESGAKNVQIDNCHVKNAKITVTPELVGEKYDNGDKAGAIIGFAYATFITNCSAENVEVTAFRDVAGIAGYASKGKIEGCSVKDATITSDQQHEYDGEKNGNAGIVVGRIGNPVTLDNPEGENVKVIRKVDSSKELDYAAADAQNGDTIYVAAGEGAIDMPKFENKKLSFEGIGDVILNQPSSTHATKDYAGSEIYFKNVTIDGTAYGVNPTYHGFVGAIKETYDACTFTDYLQFAADEVVVNDATFVCQPSQYFWTGLANDVTFNRCEFNGVDRALHLCSVIAGETHNVTLNNCEFTATELNKAAIEIDGSKGPFVLNINETTATGFAEGEHTGETMFNIKNTPENVTVYIDGNKWISKGIITDEEGNLVVNSLDTLETALKSAGAAGAGDTTIVFAENTTLDMTNTEWTPINVDGYHGADVVTVDGKNSVIKGLTAPLFHGGFAGGSGIIIKNLTITDSNIVSTNTQGSGAFIECVDSMDVITLDNCHFTNSTLSGSRTGGLVGWTSGYSNVNDGPVKLYVTIKNCSVVNVDINATGSVGGINGHAGASDWTYTTIENCTVKDCNIKSTDDGDWRTGVVVGTANIGEVTINNITASGNTIEQVGKTAPEGDVRRLYGRAVLGSTGKLTIDGKAIVANGAIKDENGNITVNEGGSVNAAIAAAEAGSTIVLDDAVADCGTITVGELKDVTIEGGENTIMTFTTTADTKIENVTLKNIGFEYVSADGSNYDTGVVINESAQIDNLVIEGCTFTGNGEKKGRGISGKNNNATIELKGCTFKNLGYPIYAWGGYEALILENCTFDDIKSWAIMPQSGFDGDMTVTGCTFKNCLGGGLIKAGTLTAGHTFTFTNNTITNCTVTGDHNWFQFNVSAGTSVISGNTKDGQPWTPTTADGLK